LFTADSTGEWILTATNGLCTESDTMRITVMPDLAGLDTTICEGDTLTLGEYDLPGVTYLWSPATGLDDPAAAYPVASPLSSSVYTLMAYGDACIQTASWLVEVTPPPIPDFYFVPEQPEATQEIHFVNQSTFSSVWYWNFGDGSSSALFNPLHSYLADGTYSTAFTASNEGCSRTLFREITVHSDPRIFLPNAFTPNGDGLNDVLEVKGLQLDGFEMSIYDRNGKLVEVMTDPSQGWDGSINGIAAPEGAYTYRLLFKSSEGHPAESSGQVLLIR
jgi:gliding motility-associated-like protein